MSDSLPPSRPRGGTPVLDALPAGSTLSGWPPERGMVPASGPGALGGVAPSAAVAAAGSARRVAVPILTEVLDVAAAFATTQPPPQAGEPAPAIDEAELTQRVLDSLRPQLQPLLEQRLLDAMTLLVGNACEAIVSELGASLEPMLREAIARELASELARRDAP